MKKITEVPGLQVNKQHRGLKIASALSIAIPIFTTAFQHASAAINKYDSNNQLITRTGLKESKKASPGWGGVLLGTGWYSGHSGWIDGDGNRYYCMNPDQYSAVDHLKVKTQNQVSANANAQIRAALYLGYGVNSAADLGVSDTNKAEYATQLAIWHIIGWQVRATNPDVQKVYNHIVNNLSKYTSASTGSTSLNITTVSTNKSKGEKVVKISGKEFGKSLSGNVNVKVSGGLTATQGSKKVTSSGTMEMNKNITLQTGKATAGKPVVSKDASGNKVEKITYTFPTGKLTVSRDSCSLRAPTYLSVRGYQTGVTLVALENLTYKNRQLAKHEEINDVAQTITVDHIKTCKPAAIIKTPTPTPSTTITTTLPQTGNSDDMLTQLLGAATLVITIGSAVYFVRRRQTTGLN